LPVLGLINHKVNQNEMKNVLNTILVTMFRTV